MWLGNYISQLVSNAKVWCIDLSPNDESRTHGTSMSGYGYSRAIQPRLEGLFGFPRGKRYKKKAYPSRPDINTKILDDNPTDG